MPGGPTPDIILTPEGENAQSRLEVMSEDTAGKLGVQGDV